MRSEKTLARNRVPDIAALHQIDILWVERNETSVSASEAINSRLLIGVNGGAGFGSFLLSRVERAFAPGTFFPQM